MKNNKLIAEFMGYKLTKCNRGQAWERPTLSSIHDDYKLHGRLWVENDSYYKWGTSWDWLMPVLKKINLQIHPDTYGLWRMINTPTEYPIEKVHAQAVEFIKEYNNER